MSWRHIRAIARKEIQHIFRDRSTFFLVLLSPTLLLLLMAYSLTVDLEHIPVAVLDYDRSATSRQFIQRVVAGDDLDLYTQVNTLAEVDGLLMRGEVKAVLILNPGFGRDIQALEGSPIQIIIDGTEPESGGFAVEHVGRRAEEFLGEIIEEYAQQLNISPGALEPLDLRVRAWYNPNLTPRVDLIPGLISMVLGFPALSVALTLAHEREHGTLEQLMATPIRRGDLMLGKMVPYVLVGMANVILIPLLSVIWFNIPINGSFPLFVGLSFLFMFAILSMGIIIGVFIPTQAGALALSFLVIFFPGFFLTGIFFPIASMPELVRLEALFLPGTHYAIITRGIFLSAIGIEELWPNAAFLVVLGVAFTAIAALFFRKKLG
jgi:ABC-2 type transport system permease protein